MSGPASIPEYLALIRQSGLVDEAALGRFWQFRQADIRQAQTAPKLAGLLVKDGLLTPFQAEQLLAGKWRRFSIGRYTVLEQLGAGGMATVYLCQHKHMKRRAAVKVLPAKLAADPSCVARFYREARAVAALDHPNIVRAFDVAEDDGIHFLALEYVEGPTLQEMVRFRGTLGTLQVMHYMRQAAAGLQHAFQAGIIHRDIKPGNLLVDLSGTVKILDLGLARFFTDEKDDLTVMYDDVVLGTADYLAPESAESCRNSDVRSDIYALGCTFYFCLTGQPPFPEGTLANKLVAHMKQKPRPIRELRPEVPRDLAAVIDKAMAKRPKDRYQTPADLIGVLTGLLAQHGETAIDGMAQTLKESSRWHKQQLRHWRRRVLTAGIALLVGGLTSLYATIRALFAGKNDKPPASKPRANTGDTVQL